MGKPYSLDLRHRICRYVAAGNSCRAAGRVFGVSAATAVRYVADQRERATSARNHRGDQRVNLASWLHIQIS